MTARAVMQRASAIGNDNFGQPLSTTPQGIGSVPILAWEDTITRVVDGDKLVVIPVVRGVVRSSDSVLESDQISSITDARGNDIFPGTMTVTTVEPARNGLKRITARRAKAA